MNLEDFYNFCITKKGVTESFPFDKDTLVFKVGAKMFALTNLSGFEIGNPTVNLKCDPEKAQELRAEYDDIDPGFHMSKKHWNTVKINNNLSDNLVFDLIDHSYNLVFNSLSKKNQSEIAKY